MKRTRPLTLVCAALGAALALLALLFMLGMHHPAAADAPDDTGNPQSMTVAVRPTLTRPALDPTAHPILSNLQVRRAIAYCTDKDALLSSVYPDLNAQQRQALIANTFIPTASWAYTPPAVVYAYNPTTGRALLDAAGWTLAPGATYRTKDGKELYLTLRSTDAAFRQTFLAEFESQMHACGVHLVRDHRSGSWLFGDTTGLQVRDFELGEYAWVISADDAGGRTIFACDQIAATANGWTGQNYTGWCNPAASNAIIQATNPDLSQAERRAHYAVVIEHLAGDLPVLPLFWRANDDGTPSGIWEHIDFNLETFAQDRSVGPAGTRATPLLYHNHDDLPTRVAIPAGALAAPIDLRFTPLFENANPPPGGQIAVSSFRMDAVQGGVPAASFDLAGPAVVTVSYPDPALTGDFVEDSLALHVWDPAAQAWQPAVETCPPGQQYAALDTVQRTVTTHVCHLSEFALLAEHLPDLVLSINFSHDWLFGWYPPDHTVWITLTDSVGTVKATAQMTTGELPDWDGETGFATWIDDPWQPEQPDLQPGDWVHGAVDNGRTAAVQIGLITGAVDADTDSITGTVDAAWLLPGPVDVECQAWGAPGWAPNKQDAVTPDGNDTYACSWDPDNEWDVQPGQDIAVIYREPDGHQIYGVFRAPVWDLILDINYDHDWVEGNYEPGYTVWITVTDSAGDVKATAEMLTGEVPWWGGRTGFSTNWDDPWQPGRPDIQPGDWVHGAVSTGYSASVQIGLITGHVDVDADSITGTVDAAWLMPGPVDVECQTWGAPGWAPNKQDTVTPDGNDTYACAWDPDNEWDVQPGQDIAVLYREPDGHQIYGVFREPAPRLHVEKRLDGGNPGQGGNAVFTVEYRNEGDADAKNVVITDTMQGFTYLADSSGFPVTTGVTPGGDPFVAWQLGTLEPGEWLRFDVFAAVTAGAGQSVRNTAQIATSNPFNTSDPWQLESVWQGQVAANDTDVNVGKWAWTWEPAPGHDFVYVVGICNNGSTGSTAVTLTDTLPLSTTLVSWWGREVGWVELDAADQLLVLQRPSVGGQRCNEAYIRVHLDEAAWPGMELVNAAQISAANDLDPDDNQSTMSHRAGYPYRDLSIEQRWQWGTLVPGGHIRYQIDFRNEGNLPVSGPALITATLPTGTTFNGWDSWGWAEVSLSHAGAGQVVWEVNGLNNGYSGGIELRLDVAQNAPPGTLLINQVEIARQPNEVDVANNRSVWQEILYPHGPNLRLRKEAEWRYEQGHNAQYRIVVENVGDQTVNDVTITDHYPAQMVLDGSPDVNYWRWWEWEDHPDDHYFTVTLEALEPTWNVHINYGMRIPGDDPIPWGLVLGNTADVTLAANDTNPIDNSATAMLGTGPDLYVEKTLTAGQPATSELVTFTLRFGNAQPWHAWWWNLQGNAWLTDTLPAGMTYVAAYLRHCGSDEPRWCERPPDEIDGQTLRWRQYRLNPGDWNEIRLVAQIDALVAVPATLVNRAGIASDQPDADIEPFYDNNQASLGVRVLPAETVVYLPLVLHYSAPPAEWLIYLPLVLRP